MKWDVCTINFHTLEDIIRGMGLWSGEKSYFFYYAGRSIDSVHIPENKICIVSSICVLESNYEVVTSSCLYDTTNLLRWNLVFHLQA